MNRELVVAHYNEDLSWLNDVPKNWRIRIYEKGSGKAGIELPNIHREPHTFLWHIYMNYDNLADVTCFVQGKPFDHCPNLLEILSRPIDYRFTGFMHVGDKWYYSNEDGAPHDSLPLKAIAEHNGLFLKYPVGFTPGGQFVVSKSVIHKRPMSFYRDCLLSLDEFHRSAWCFERLWGSIFEVQ